MKIQVIKIDNKIIFNLSTAGRTRLKKYHILHKDILKMLNEKEDLTNYRLLSRESDGDILPSMSTATYVFEKKEVDILKNNVSIKKINDEAKSPEKEQKKEASLPYGLKKTTKRKRATKNKTTEE